MSCRLTVAVDDFLGGKIDALFSGDRQHPRLVVGGDRTNPILPGLDRGRGEAQQSGELSGSTEFADDIGCGVHICHNAQTLRADKR